MTIRSSRSVSFAAALAALSCASGTRDEPSSTPELRAVAFLSREVREWPTRNKCFSCHNNGDAARVLYTARRLSVPVDPRSVEATTLYLTRPEEWRYNGPKREFSDKKLATLQFASALAAAVEAGAVDSNAAFLTAAEMVRDHQEADGSWRVDAEGLPGSPVTYGRTLATVVARQVLAGASRARFAEAIDRADTWLRRQRPGGVLDAAAVLLGLKPMNGQDVLRQRRECLEVIRNAQTREGGWGPYVTSPPEIFDTAVVLLGLATVRDQAGVPEMARRGREFLVIGQQADGSWPETTRPPGAESYAQRISTSGWAALALLSTPSR